MDSFLLSDCVPRLIYSMYWERKDTAILGLSPARFTQKFKADFGITPMQHLTSIRLEKAKRFLLETTLTLEQISESIGYQNGYYLNRIFMKHMKVTPAKYRKAHTV
ncbi:helix-turn-helix transcriptional regulator [Paenibacillus mesophilus]|uniref:helix-turn-helix domain-containing protein n=1 Tax=Paenibacillus mesophilus TaxID=2582849 RepID=UPI00110F5E7E|nr:helix-turn-helix domain-containing protein [Paenibacillus mesophilus]TMV48638.1 helix-turn-helix transcriptional regulator [Paenibacillus mesophilus]